MLYCWVSVMRTVEWQCGIHMAALQQQLKNTFEMSAVTEAEIELATALNVPLLGASPPVVAAIKAKAGARALFQRARMNVAPGICMQPVEGSSQVVGVQEALQTLDALSTGGWGGGMESWAGANAPDGRSSIFGGTPGNMKLSFALKHGDLIVKDRRECKVPNATDRKDRVLCEHIAKGMLLPGAKTTQV